MNVVKVGILCYAAMLPGTIFFYFEENIFMQTNVLNITYGYGFRHILNNPTWAHYFLYRKL